jgi:hypothetical protein
MVHQHLPGPGLVGEAGGGVDGVPDDGEPGRFARGRHHHLAGCNAGVDLGERGAGPAAAQLASVVSDGEARPHGPFGVILMRGRHAEDGWLAKIWQRAM